MEKKYSNSKLEYACSLIQSSLVIDDSIIPFIVDDNLKYVYGNGLQAAVCIQIFRDLGIEIQGLVLPPGIEKAMHKGYWGELLKKQKITRFDVMPEDAYILLAIPRQEYKSAKILLCGMGRLFECCWEHNSDMNEVCWKVNEKHKRGKGCIEID